MGTRVWRQHERKSYGSSRNVKTDTGCLKSIQVFYVVFAMRFSSEITGTSFDKLETLVKRFLSRYSYGLDGRGSSPSRGKIFLFSTTSRPALGPTQPPIQWVPGVKLQGREADHSPPSSAEVKNGGAIPSLPHMSAWHSA
jgi:hypothetical protein